MKEHFLNVGLLVFRLSSRHLYETLQLAGHRQRVLAALQGVFQLLPLQADLVKRHEDVHGSAGMGRGQMLRLLLRADETGEL